MLSAESLRETCNETLARFLGPGAVVLATVYGLMAVVHLAIAPAGAVSLASGAAGTALLFLGIRLACWRWPPTPRWAHPIAAGAAGIVLANVSLYCYYAPHPPSTVQIGAVALGAGLVLLSRTWLAVELVACVAVWIVFAVLYPPFDRWVDAGYLLAAVCAVSALVHEGRLRATGRGETLRRLAMRHRDDAREALARAEREFLERSRIAQEQRELDARVAEAQRVESLGILAGGVAHDFNNLLATILASAELIEEQLPRGSSPREAATDIIVATQNAAGLTRQMLTYVGKAPVETGLVDLRRTSKELFPLARASLPASIALDIDCAAAGVIVNGDPTQIKQVLLNLITNAGEALGGGRSSLRVVVRPTRLDEAALAKCSFRDEAAPGPFVEIAVSDDGTGIDERIRSRVFDPFFSTKFTGRGLGLAAVHGIVRLHRGALDLESEVGVGTTVRVFLPRVNGERSAERPPAPKGDRVSPERRRVLVLDDDAQVCRTCARLLDKIGYQPEPFTDPMRALAWVPSAEIALAVVDLTMAGLSGDEFVERLRVVRPGLPVVLMSGYHEPVALEHLAKTGAVVFLQKPYGLQELHAACERAIDTARPARGPQRSSAESSIDSSISITGISSSMG